MDERLVGLVGNAISESSTSLAPDDTAKLVARTLAGGDSDSRKWCIEWLGGYDADNGVMTPDAQDLLQRQLQASENESSDEETLKDLRLLRDRLGVELAQEDDESDAEGETASSTEHAPDDSGES